MGHRYLRREDFKDYAATLREKTKKFKLAKSEVQSLRSEGSILKRTEQLLKERLAEAQQGLREVEEKFGVVGHDDLESRLIEVTNADSSTLMIEQASEAKSAADAKKGSQMEELSEVLRAKREELVEAEGVYLTKRTEYEAVEADLNREVRQRRSLTDKLLKETESLQSRADEIELKIIATESLVERGERERQCLDGRSRFSDEHPTLSAAYTAKIRELEKTCQTLKLQHKDVSNSLDWRMHQKQLFERLNRLLEVKLRSLTSVSADGEASLGRVEHLAKGVNRLVIESN
ncbi:hypothetical protein FOL46_007751 [Perkinsus olseni]|uniref:Uncharacterized protein n=1 Tax=Perkinsus olseni TaxID=32597 RepID=A0A7J6MNJ4_PEROL|nr:hypothetical protein FOL46_007751 [Perkinsus olseni]